MRKHIKDMERNLPEVSEDGYILVTALFFLVILTIMGTASMGIRNTEQQVTLNSEVFQHNFYVVEASTLEGATAIDNLSDTILSTPASYPQWLKIENTATIDLTKNAQWPSGFITPSNTNLTTAPAQITPGDYVSGTDRIWYAAVDTIDVNGDARCQGGSVTDPLKVEKCYDIYGMYDMTTGKSYSGKMMLQVGYKKIVYL